MPRSSVRQRELQRLQTLMNHRSQSANSRFLLDQIDCFEEDIDELLAAHYQAMAGSRYLARAPSYRKRADRWKLFLYDSSYMNDREFLEHFRVSHDAFARLVDLIRDDPMFARETHRTYRGGPKLHMLVLLKYLGGCGNDNASSELALLFGLGKGSIDNYVRRATGLILKLEASTITCPDRDERQDTAQRVHVKYGFVNCVGMTDGTLIPLEFKPILNGDDYYTRKGGYALNALVTCDDVARIRDIVVGWPGSTHDNRVWTNGRLNQEPEKFFCKNEYVLGDSAFQVSLIMIPVFKKPSHAGLGAHKSFFNTKLAKARIKTEHCIGLLKARFQFLKRVRILIKSKHDMKRLLRLIICAVVLHNILIAEPIPPAWEDEMTATVLDGDDELNSSLPSNASGELRRNQLFCFMLETRR